MRLFEYNSQRIQKLQIKYRNVLQIISIKMDQLFTQQIHKTLLGLTLEDYVNFTPLLTEHRYTRMRRNFRMFRCKVQIVDTFLYFIKYSFQKKPIQNYEYLCRQRLSEYYIGKKLKIDIYKYSRLCTQLLQVDIEKIVFLIYYLVYGKIASSPYIYAICNQAEYQLRKRSYRFSSLFIKKYSHLQSSDSSANCQLNSLFSALYAEQQDDLQKELNQVLKLSQKRPSKKKLTKPSQYEKINKIDQIFVENFKDMSYKCGKKIGKSDCSALIKLKKQVFTQKKQKQLKFQKQQLADETKIGHDKSKLDKYHRRRANVISRAKCMPLNQNSKDFHYILEYHKMQRITVQKLQTDKNISSHHLRQQKKTQDYQKQQYQKIAEQLRLYKNQIFLGEKHPLNYKQKIIQTQILERNELFNQFNQLQQKDQRQYYASQYEKMPICKKIRLIDIKQIKSQLTSYLTELDKKIHYIDQ